VSRDIAERSPATGELLGTVHASSAAEVRDVAALAARAQPLWAAVPVTARARALRRAAQAILDEVEALALLLARETGRPRTEAMLAELLPSVSGLHELADAAPGVLGDRRLGRRAVLRGGRRSALVQRPIGVSGVRGGAASPWVEPVLETAAALLAGDGVVLVPAAPLAGERLAAAFVRAGVPEELLAVRHGPDAAAALADACDGVLDLDPHDGKGTMLVLTGAPVGPAVAGALWAGFAGAGRHPAAVGRVVVVPSRAQPVLDGLVAGARRLHVGDPADPRTEIGPLPSADDVERVEALVAAAEADGAERLCGGPIDVPGLPGAFYAPAVLRGVRPDATLLREAPPGPVLAVVEAADDAAAIGLADGDPRGPVSVWAGDRDRGERIARRLQAELTWVNEHGHAAAAAPVRLGRHVRVRQLASQPPGLRSARWLPYDPTLVRARLAAARLMHGRESERLTVLRHGVRPLARSIARVARDARRP
jgi:acyl-CoA reductase-like NAD-dependent aldehyde dehydrogenase